MVSPELFISLAHARRRGASFVVCFECSADP